MFAMKIIFPDINLEIGQFTYTYCYRTGNSFAGSTSRVFKISQVGSKLIIPKNGRQTINANLTQSQEAEHIRWQPIVAKYAKPHLGRSLWQLANTLIPYFVLWGVMIWSIQISYWITLGLSVLAAGFLMRTFIIFHDCGHGSFFKSQKANDFVGRITAFLNFTPYYRWKHDHAIHHATAGDLDRRGTGDVYTMTVREYLAAPWWKKTAYRIMRNPFALLGVGPLLVFVITQRIPPAKGRREQASVWSTNFALVGVIALMCWLIGWKTFLMIQLPILMISTTIGIWLFYVQHNFDPTYWDNHEGWEFVKAGLQGSSFYKLPLILQWFSGNIGFHHIHHLSAKIPNYNLPRCYYENPLFHVQPLTIRASLKSLSLRLYDEEQRMLVGWDGLRRYPTQKVEVMNP
jgi:acyl-lipid omega-6 desaturase (Delta-12 desaturase)